MLQLNPVQFNFQKLWFESRREFMEQDGVKDALVGILNRWLEIAEFKFEEESPHDEELAREEFALDIHIGRVKVKDLHWLRETFCSQNLVDLCLAIAQYVMPGKAWEIVEDDEEGVVTDDVRSIVFDIKYGHEVSAGVSLLMAGDTKFQPTEADLVEFNDWLERRAALSQWRLDRARSDLARVKQSGVVIELPTASKTSSDL